MAASKFRQSAAAMAIGFSLAACTNITISNVENTRQPLVGFPVLNLESIKGGDVAIRRQGFGIFAEKDSFVIGYLNESTVYVRDTSKCKVIIFAKSSAEVEEIETVLRRSQTSLSTICFVKG